jgi:NAD(P)-dependent dehydrogenase (short-subunit alcohol dehydrogenase family)
MFVTTSWTMELCEFSINVNAICPGFIRSGDGGQGSGMVAGMQAQAGMASGGLSSNSPPRYNFPCGKWLVEMRHVTDTVLFLASDNAAMITGAAIPSTGPATR